MKGIYSFVYLIKFTHVLYNLIHILTSYNSGIMEFIETKMLLYNILIRDEL